MQPRIIFITGTDTGVGKTVLTALLLSYLRQSGVTAFALKPFCSGGRADAELLHSLQDGDLTLSRVNPFHFREPLAPLVAARLHQRRISLDQTLRHICQIHALLRADHRSKATQPRNPIIHKSNNPVLLIEGAGGLLAPLGERFSAADLILELRCQVIITAANRLGVLNHCLLTVRYLQAAGIQQLKVVLIDPDAPEKRSCITPRPSSSNPKILSELLHPTPVFCLPHLPELTKSLGKTERTTVLQESAKKLKKSLAQILG